MVAGCRYTTPKSILVHKERFMKTGLGIIDGFLVQLRHFCQANPHFGAKSLAKRISDYGCTLVLYHIKVNLGSCVRFMKLGMGIIYVFLCSPNSIFSTKLVPILGQNRVNVLLF